jgi:hypothetical protein
VARAEEGSRGGRGRRVEVIPAGGGAAAVAKRWARGESLRRRQGGRAEHVLGEEEGRGPEDLFGNSKNFRDLSVKKYFPLI